MSSLLEDNKTAAKERFTRERILRSYEQTRTFSHTITECLEPEDFVIQPMESASPTKWHLAHTSWFFETFVLGKFDAEFSSMHPQYAYLFNSYYLQTGVPFTRSQRGVISRPTVKDVFEYRAYVNEKMKEFIEQVDDEVWTEAAPVIEIGINHEQQHQELILTDIKYTLAQNPLLPVYRDIKVQEVDKISALEWISFEEGITEIGHPGDAFTYDNEHPQHRTFVQNYALSDRLVTNGEYLEFMKDAGYERSELWLDEGWTCVRSEEWKAPLYWFVRDGEWWNYTLSGARKVNLHEPVTHVSYFEADAFARWKGVRLPTEQEWEHASKDLPVEGNFVEKQSFHTSPLKEGTSGLKQMYGDVWEWTSSSYAPYPGYKPLPGALGEYNGKFMSNQYVLRGGSCATSQTHIRNTYRNFFQARSRWQFSGIRLAK